MRCVALVAAAMALAAGRLPAQHLGGLEALRDKAEISPDDREKIRAWLRPLVNDLVASTDPELRRVVRARTAIVAAGRSDLGSAAYVQVYGEEAVAALQAAAPRAVSPEARLNLVLTVVDLRRVEAVPFLAKVLTDDPYAATRYLAAKGLAAVAPEAGRKGGPRSEEAIADAARRAMETETAPLVFYWLLEGLAHLDRAEAHDALALGAGQAAMRLRVSDPVSAQAVASAVRALEKAYGEEVRPDGRERLLTAYAVLCAWVLPPSADPGLMKALSDSLGRVTGSNVEFSPGLDPVMQKLALLEWVERLVRERRIPRRPPLPPAVEKVVERVVPPP